MDLWEKYAEVVRRFEPTRRWEEAALIFGLIQSVRMKNQLFNYNLSASRSGVPGPGLGLDLLNLSAPEPRSRPAGAEPAPEPAPAAAKPAGRGSARQGKPKAGKLIPLRPGKD
jgi:hypothetical protein